jgi:hypothetical protein
MPDVNVPQGFTLDAPSAAKPPSGFSLDVQAATPKRPTESPSTSVSGILGAATRGLAPLAAGAGIGGMVGGPPGAIVGAGAEGLSQLALDAYNMAAPHFGLPKTVTPQEATDWVLDQLGVSRARTFPERMVQDVAGVAPIGIPAFSGLTEAIAENSAAKAEKFIRQSYEKAVRPTVVGKSTSPQLVQAQTQARSAVDSIVGNKGNLVYRDESGVEIGKGELPKNLEQFADAISQTKESIFAKYDAMAQAAGQQGAHVNLSPVVQELQKIANDRVVQTVRPGVAKSASDMAENFAKARAFSALDTQRAIQNLNESLKAFYKNPTYEVVGNAGLDALIANQLRTGLDRAIESATGPGYQALKNQYGALRSIEKDVVHRSIVDARQAAGGGLLGRLGDIASGEEVIRGVLTLNPSAFARGVALKGYTSTLKRLRDPNRAVRRMFDVAEKQYKVPTVYREPQRQLPPPTVYGPQQPWIGTPGGPIPPNPARLSTSLPGSGVGTPAYSEAMRQAAQSSSPPP